MADIKLRLAQNKPGAFYVTSECIDCDMCREIAATVFKRNDDISFSVVVRQPETETERQQAEEAVASCPVDAIGNDGLALSTQASCGETPPLLPS
jgi:ferredoxin